MKLFVSLTLSLTLFAFQTIAFEVAPGIYDVEGVENDGKRIYQDVVKITLGPDGACSFDLGVAPDVIEGICVVETDLLSASSTMGGHWVGLYRATGEGQLRGIWRIEGEAGTGTETLSLRK